MLASGLCCTSGDCDLIQREKSNLLVTDNKPLWWVSGAAAQAEGTGELQENAGQLQKSSGSVTFAAGNACGRRGMLVPV